MGNAKLPAVIYVRISEDRSGAGLGVEQQERDCRTLADRLGLVVRKVYCDNDISASSYSRKVRPAYRRLLRDIQADPADIVCMHTDRLYRQPRELEDLVDAVEKLGVTVHTVQAGEIDLSTGSGQMIARMLGAAAAHESKRMSERRAARKQAQRLAGEYGGGPRPFGYEKDGTTVRLHEAEAIQRGTKDLIDGRTLYSIVRDWNAAGLRPSGAPFGPLQRNPWTARQVSRVLRRARNAGLIEHEGQLIGKAAWPALVSEDQWRAVRGILGDPSRKVSPGPARKHLLSGIATCGVCGGPLVVSYSGGKTGRAVYRCRPQNGAGHVSRTVEALDEYIGRIVTGILTRPGHALPELTADMTLAHVRLAAINAQLDELAEAAGKMEITARQLAIASGPLEAEAQRLREHIEASSAPDALAPFRGKDDPATVWEGLDLDRRRGVIKWIISAIVVNPAPKGRPPRWQSCGAYFYADSITVTPREA
jgi:site-specific DNA recombinase